MFVVKAIEFESGQREFYGDISRGPIFVESSPNRLIRTNMVGRLVIESGSYCV